MISDLVSYENLLDILLDDSSNPIKRISTKDGSVVVEVIFESTKNPSKDALIKNASFISTLTLLDCIMV